MRLDYNKDGHVSYDDLSKGAKDLYEFIVTFNYYQKAIEIKSKLYNEAIKYMKNDLAKDEREQAAGDDDNIE